MNPDHADLEQTLRRFDLFDAVADDEFTWFRDNAQWLSLLAGQTLFSQGDDSQDGLYVVVVGHLVAVKSDGPRAEVINHIWPGETVGEYALVNRIPRSATVRALRDCALVRLPSDAFERVVDRAPRLLWNLSRGLIERALRLENTRPRPRTDAHLIAVVAASDTAPLAEVARRLARAAADWGETLHLDSARVDAQLGAGASQSAAGAQHTELVSWLDRAEREHDVVLLEADRDNTAWTQRCIRHADAVLLVAAAGDTPGAWDVDASLRAQPDIELRRRELLLVHPARTAPRGTRRWLSAFPVTRHHHVALDDDRDIRRVARFLANRAVSLTLSGGGALGYAHVGVLRALDEADIPVDLVCGASMGSIVAALAARDMRWSQIRDAFHDATVRHRLLRPTIPVMSLFRPHTMDRFLEAQLGDLDIEDLWLPFFCVSSNLTRAELIVHTTGSARRAARASAALCGVFPPIEQDGDVLADGAFLNNLPVDIARRRCPGYAIAVNVVPHMDATLRSGFSEDMSPLRALTSQLLSPLGVKRSANMLDLVLRGIFLSTAAHINEIQDAVDLYIHPPASEFDFLDFKQLDKFVANGYAVARADIARWRQRSPDVPRS